MNIEQEHAHIVNFINGFESIVKQNKFKHYIEVGGIESYTIGVMTAEGTAVDLITGAENFISNGVKKLWEMVSNFFKGIWNFFFGSEKKAEKAVTQTEEISKTSDEVKSAISAGKVAPPPTQTSEDMSKHYAKVARINKHVIKLNELLQKATTYIDSDASMVDAIKQMKDELVPNVTGRMANLLGELAITGEKFNNAIAELDVVQTSVKGYKVPEGNRLDAATLNSILSMVNRHSSAAKKTIRELKLFLEGCGELITEVKNNGGMPDVLASRILRMLQITQAKMAGKLKRLCSRIQEIKNECDALHKLIVEK